MEIKFSFHFSNQEIKSLYFVSRSISNLHFSNSEWMDLTAKKILADKTANVILVDYETLSNCNYIYLAKRVVYELGEYLAESIDCWDLDLNQTRIIAHSLGAHIAGNAGIFLTQMTGKKLARIDGLFN